MQEKFMVVYLVRSSRTYARIRSLTTGTFNRVVKDRIAFRLSGAPSVLDGLVFAGEPTTANPAVLETLQTYVAAETLSTLASHRISTRFPQREDCQNVATGEPRLEKSHATICVFRLAMQMNRRLIQRSFSGTRRRKTKD